MRCGAARRMKKPWRIQCQPSLERWKRQVLRGQNGGMNGAARLDMPEIHCSPRAAHNLHRTTYGVHLTGVDPIDVAAGQGPESLTATPMAAPSVTAGGVMKSWWVICASASLALAVLAPTAPAKAINCRTSTDGLAIDPTPPLAMPGYLTRFIEPTFGGEAVRIADISGMALPASAPGLVWGSDAR